jgi:protein-tyrosine phosphatase
MEQWLFNACMRPHFGTMRYTLVAMIRVLFICMGNICRSPMAEAVMQRMVEQAGLADRIAVDSVGTGSWHIGEPAHYGTRDVLRRQGIDYTGCARQITRADIREADYLIAMDRENVAAVREIESSPVVRQKLRRLLEFVPRPETLDVPDPYFDGSFDTVYRLVEAGCRGLLDHIRAEHKL